MALNRPERDSLPAVGELKKEGKASFASTSAEEHVNFFTVLPTSPNNHKSIMNIELEVTNKD